MSVCHPQTRCVERSQVSRSLIFGLVRPVKAFLLPALVCSAIASTGCEKPTAKFHPGDNVRVPRTDTRGVVVTRLSPLRDDLYYLRVPGAPEELDKTWDWSRFKPYPRQTHLEGPYYDNELEPTK
jgi:hypothetical protein